MIQLFQAMREGRRTSKTGSPKTHVVSLKQDQKNLILIKELLGSGKVVPVIDGCYPLGRAVEAFWYFEKVHAKGKIVIVVEQTN